MLSDGGSSHSPGQVGPESEAGSKAVQIERSLPSQAPSYSPLPPPGLTSWGRLQEARPDTGPPLPPGQYTTSDWNPASALKLTEPLRRPPKTLDRTAFWEL